MTNSSSFWNETALPLGGILGGFASCLFALGCNLGVLSPAWAQVDPIITNQSYTNDSSGSTLVSETTPKAQDNPTTNLPTGDAPTQVESNQDYELLSQVEQYSESEAAPAIESASENELLSQIEQYSGSQPASAVPTLPENEILSQIEQYSISERPRRRRRSFPRVDSLVDVTPEDWAYDALRTLMNNYRCLAGYGDDTFRGNNNLTRYEFAAALRRCLQRVETIIKNNFDLATEEDLASIERLIEEFEAELAIVKDKVSDQEGRVEFLDNNNFSTTTILRGSANFLLNKVFGERKAVPSGQIPTEDLDTLLTFSGGVQLNFDTSFTGRDLLRTNLRAGRNRDVSLGKLFYRFPVGDRASVYVATTNQSASEFVPVLNPASSISAFASYNPLYDVGAGAGGGIYYQFTDLIGVGVSYYTGSSNSPNPGKGFFNGDFAALSQITFTPSDRLGIALAYTHYYSPQPGSNRNVTNSVGSEFAQLPFGKNTATTSDNLNIVASYQISDRLQVGGWVGYFHASAQSSALVNGLSIPQGSNADIWTWAFTASYNDLIKLGSKLNFIFGMPPKLTDNDISQREDQDTSYHIELSYRYPIADRISITSGGFVTLAPEHNKANNDIWTGLIRVNFSF
ncbi:MAG: iron uptake porin [Symploca sp. SIO3E6]|nr:iron uptake porin [Caldora sp. SIO3E6]